MAKWLRSASYYMYTMLKIVGKKNNQSSHCLKNKNCLERWSQGSRAPCSKGQLESYHGGNGYFVLTLSDVFLTSRQTHASFLPIIQESGGLAAQKPMSK